MRNFFFFLMALVCFSIPVYSKNKVVCDSANAGNNQQACSDSILLQGNVPISGSGFWTCINSPAFILNPNTDSTLATSLSVGQNIFVWTIVGTGGCPTVSDTVIYTVDSIPTRPNAGFDLQICGNSTAISGNQPVIGTGMWVIFSGTANISNPYSPSTTISNLNSGTTTLRWTISAGSCVRYDEVVITKYDLPTVSNAGPDQIICDTSFFLNANTPSSGNGQWNLIDGVGKIFKPNFASTSVDSAFYGDTLVFVWTISSGVCPSSSDTISVIINTPPSPANAGNDQIICSPITVLTAIPALVGTGHWSQISGSSNITDTLSPVTAIAAVGLGINTFVWTIESGACHYNADTVTITNSGTSANAGQDQFLCAVSSSLLADSILSGNGVWNLVNGGGNILLPNSNATIVSNLSIGQNIFVWSVSNGVCPSTSDTVVLTVYAPSTVAFAGADFVVCGTSANLSASGAVNGVGTWSVISGTGNFSAPNSGSTLVSGLSSGSNSFAWTIVNGVCPSSSDTITIMSLSPSGNAFAGNDTTICSDSIQLYAAAPFSGTGSWAMLTAGPQLSATNITNPTASGLTVGQNIFVWTVAGSGNCPSSSDSVIVVRDMDPTPAYAGSDITTDKVEIVLAANSPLIGSGLWSIVSSTGNIMSPSTPNSIFSVSQSGDYSLVWTTSNGVCPSSSDTVNINVRFEIIPEVITPNNDGKNDFFKINPLLFTNNIELYIYNRWGEMVYESADYHHDFSGKNNAGVDLADDSYFYEVFLNGIIKYKGYLLIKRK